MSGRRFYADEDKIKEKRAAARCSGVLSGVVGRTIARKCFELMGGSFLPALTEEGGPNPSRAEFVGRLTAHSQWT